LKGAAGSLGAAATAAAALQLERQGRTGELDKAAGLFAALQLEVEKLQAALACWGAADAA
jgi:HPt (histidine-containing phosphotransfer) domain-containing protein